MNLIALKEWAVAVRAMEMGRQNIVFRKGGISEPEGDFKLTHNEFLLYPAREHQKPEYLKPDYLSLLKQVQDEQVGHLIEIRSRAIVSKIQLIHDEVEAQAYYNQHVWNQSFIQMRLDYKPDRPLYAIELALTLLPQPISFIETTEQAGCKSWVEIKMP